MAECTVNLNSAQIWSFGSIVLDETSFELKRSDVPVAIEPQSLRVLFFLTVKPSKLNTGNMNKPASSYHGFRNKFRDPKDLSCCTIIYLNIGGLASTHLPLCVADSTAA